MQKFAQQLDCDTLRRLLPQLFSDFANSIQRPFKTAAAATIIAKRGSSQASKACTIAPHHYDDQHTIAPHKKNLLRRDLNQTFFLASYTVLYTVVEGNASST